MDEHGGYYSKRNKPDKGGQTAWCHLYVEFLKKEVELIESESRVVNAMS